jgi:hypothetical protein
MLIMIIMKTIKIGVAVAALLLCGAVSSKANFNLTLGNTSLRAEAGLTATLDGSPLVPSQDPIGIYSFTASANSDGIPSSFWSVCISPAGFQNWFPHEYSKETFAAAAPGLNPATALTWANGIQNATYLWRSFSSGIGDGQQAEGAALALAMYAALYNSTGLGVVDTSPTARFQVTGWQPGVQAFYLADLAVLNVTDVTAHQADGYVLVPTNPTEYGSGQDFIFNSDPVPEPTTIIAGALLLLPFGASTLRILRRRA